ncbi:hypothetical protein [Pseudomonas sp. M30-35]|uniref:hypothetical protein n=1 Tax=Pseudomonas sp. M30-35 TaxID=1981174 RepID=UPI000B3D389C|nr:hypothetical protein [Pseudomonas sp. M30-35]ARU86820.1 hypothetical protein B9K09_01915 [Pseudomonas sp. M30-35]
MQLSGNFTTARILFCGMALSDSFQQIAFLAGFYPGAYLLNVWRLKSFSVTVDVEREDVD